MNKKNFRAERAELKRWLSYTIHAQDDWAKGHDWAECFIAQLAGETEKNEGESLSERISQSYGISGNLGDYIDAVWEKMNF